MTTQIVVAASTDPRAARRDAAAQVGRGCLRLGGLIPGHRLAGEQGCYVPVYALSVIRSRRPAELGTSRVGR
jgi:hypothetical protein